MSTPISPFLSSLTFLTDEQRAALQAQDLDCPEALHGYPVERLVSRFGLSEGKAQRVLAAARPIADEHTPREPAPFRLPPRIEIVTTPHAQQVSVALAAAAADKARLADLQGLRVRHVVLAEDGSVDPATTEAMLAQVAAGLRVGPTFAGRRVASVDDLIAGPIWCAPDSGRPLELGCDPDDEEVRWADLGLDGLRVAVYGYVRDAFVGMTKAAVLAALKPGGNLRAKLERRAKNEGFDLAAADDRVVMARRPAPTSPTHGIAGHKAPAASTGSPQKRLCDFLLARFGADEIRSLVRYLPIAGANDVARQLPEAVSPARLAFDVTDLLRRHGMIGRELRDALVSQRPKFAAEIDSIMQGFGVS